MKKQPVKTLEDVDVYVEELAKKLVPNNYQTVETLDSIAYLFGENGFSIGDTKVALDSTKRIVEKYSLLERNQVLKVLEKVIDLSFKKDNSQLATCGPSRLNDLIERVSVYLDNNNRGMALTTLERLAREYLVYDTKISSHPGRFSGLTQRQQWGLQKTS